MVEDNNNANINKYPIKTLDEVLKTVNKWLYIEKPEDIKIILACALDRRIKGEPIWLFIIAPPGNTKTEIIRSFKEGDIFYQLSTLTPNSMISGYIKKDGNKVSDLAPQLNGKVLIIKDFTSILTLSKDKRDEIIGQLRDAYDGYISRKLGNIDNKITCTTKFGIIAGVTPVIDRHYRVMGQLGERFLKIRLNYDDDKILEMAENNEGKEEQMREEISQTVMGFLTNLEINENILFTETDLSKIKNLSKFIARLRTPIMVKFEGDELTVDIIPQSEKPTRIYKQLKKLAIALCNIEGKNSFDDDIYKMLLRSALDSVPQDRLLVIKGLIKETSSCSESILADKLRIPRINLQRIMWGLYKLGIVNRQVEKIDNSDYVLWLINDDNKTVDLESIFFCGQPPAQQIRQSTEEPMKVKEIKM